MAEERKFVALATLLYNQLQEHGGRKKMCGASHITTAWKNVKLCHVNNV
jgi:hypothetical protein